MIKVRWSIVQWSNGIVDVHDKTGKLIIRGKKSSVLKMVSEVDLSNSTFSIGSTGDYLSNTQITKQDFFNKFWK